MLGCGRDGRKEKESVGGKKERKRGVRGPLRAGSRVVQHLEFCALGSKLLPHAYLHFKRNNLYIKLV